MQNAITYRKPCTKDRAVMAASGKARISSHAYKGFDIVKCLVGGYRIEFHGSTIESVVSLKAGKVKADKLAKLIA